MPRIQNYKGSTHLPIPTDKTLVSIYSIQDEIDQSRPYSAGNFLTTVPQSVTAILVTVLKDSHWFAPLERQGLQDLLSERKIVRAIQESGTIAISNRIPLQSPTTVNVMVEGLIIGHGNNAKSGGVGTRRFGIGAGTQYQPDQIAVSLCVVNVSTGEIPSLANTDKTILSYEVQAGVFRFIDYQHLLEGKIGHISNEPVMPCLMPAIEMDVIFPISDGIDRGLRDLQDKKQVDSDILVKYRHTSVPPES